MTSTRFLCLIAACLLAVPAAAEPTEIIVRVMAKDAKFVGSETGGVQITLRDADTGEVLAQGLTAGTTGNTPKIMTDGRARRDVLSDGMAAKFSATLDLQRPRRITVTAAGPTNPSGSATSASSTQWVIPGKSVNGGDGWVLELPGFAIALVDALPPNVKLSGATKISLKAKVTMQCGCPITPGGMWDANKFQIAAMLERGGKIYPSVALVYAGQPSTFSGDIVISEPGDYVLDLYAYDPSNGNTGVDRVNLHAQ
jgi:hypothetical protein